VEDENKQVDEGGETEEDDATSRDEETEIRVEYTPANNTVGARILIVEMCDDLFCRIRFM
jgi:hypothetical protein